MHVKPAYDVISARHECHTHPDVHAHPSMTARYPAPQTRPSRRDCEDSGARTGCGSSGGS